MSATKSTMRISGRSALRRAKPRLMSSASSSSRPAPRPALMSRPFSRMWPPLFQVSTAPRRRKNRPRARMVDSKSKTPASLMAAANPVKALPPRKMPAAAASDQAYNYEIQSTATYRRSPHGHHQPLKTEPQEYEPPSRAQEGETPQHPSPDALAKSCPSRLDKAQQYEVYFGNSEGRPSKFRV